MTKIFLLPYTNQTYFSYKNRVSGVDEALLKQMNALRMLGHKVETYIPFTDIQHKYEGVNFYAEDITDAKATEKIYSKKIIKQMVEAIAKFKPDIILSNRLFGKKVYKDLFRFNIPIAYMSHSCPGWFVDVVSADYLSEFLGKGNTLLGVSEYHVARTKEYYENRRKDWTFTDSIIADDFVFSSYSDEEDIIMHDGVVRHVSAASKDKDTFLIHQFLEDSPIKSEVYTTVKHMHKETENADTYVTKNIEKYPDNTNFDIPHADIMKNIAKSACTFVGLHPLESFTITSLESLSRGVPLIVKPHKKLETHPALEMVEPEFRKYIYMYKDKADFEYAVNMFTTVGLDERKALAASCFKTTSKESYAKKLETVLDNAIKKHVDINKNVFTFF